MATNNVPAHICIFLLDDHEIVRRGPRDRFEAEGDIGVIVKPMSASDR